MTPNHTQTGKRTAGSHTPFWLTSIQPISYNKLKENLQADLVVVGGGIAGVSVAYCLSKVGKKVVLVEDGYIGSGETGRTTAHLTNVLDDRFYELEKTFGEESSKLAANSHSAAINFIEQTCKLEQIECEFKRVDGYLFLNPTDDEKNIQKEYEATLRAGLQVTKVDEVPGMILKAPALKFANQGQFHPMLYLKGLCDAIIKNGGKIYTETRAQEIDDSGIITSDGFKVLADYVVVATNAPFSSKFVLPLKQFAYRTYAIAALVEKSKIPTSLWWDTGDHDVNPDTPPYHYIRTQPYNDTHDLLISGGEDHATGLADAEGKAEEDRYESLETWTRKYFPIGEIVYRWSGQVMEPVDMLANIGKNPDAKNSNIYVVTGDSGNGMTHGTIAGILLRDLMTGKENPWEKLYSPSRPQIIKKTFSWLKEMWNKGFVEYLTTSPDNTDFSKIENLQVGEGAIVKIDSEKCGVYKDPTGDLHIVNAKCTHLGCIVKWNNDEKSWDCPCHGSRFTFTGDILNGPANVPLEYHKEADKKI